MERRHAVRGALLLAAALLGYAFVMNAWATEDAYISFRTVENFTGGHGLTWNPGERVQAFTHPLWVLLMSAAHALTSEVYLTSIALSFLLLFSTLLVLYRTFGRTTPGTLLAMTLLLVSSKAFVDYASSGLENALSYLLAAAFFTYFLYGKREQPTRKSILLMFLLASLAFTTRQDTILLYAPALVYAAVTATRHLGTLIVAPIGLGLLPAIAWEIFSLVYYGFPFPNSAYAKLSTGIPVTDLAGQAVWYFVNSLKWDSLTLVAIVGAVVYAGLRRDGLRRAAALGLVFYLLYIFRIGGDFMSGRFFAVPFLIALILLASIPLNRSAWIAVAAVVVAVLVVHPGAPLRSTRS